MRPFRFLPLMAALIFPGGSALAQTTYTESVSALCQQEVCNGLPLDQGGTWQFILANRAFSINSNGFYIFGNPGVPGTGGGIFNVQDGIPEPPNCNGCMGAGGTLTFNWAASTQDQSVHYLGHAVVNGHEVRHCNQHGCWDQMVVDATVADPTQIFIDSKQ